jgi:hypothetical protein
MNLLPKANRAKAVKPRDEEAKRGDGVVALPRPTHVEPPRIATA